MSQKTFANMSLPINIKILLKYAQKKKFYIRIVLELYSNKQINSS